MREEIPVDKVSSDEELVAGGDLRAKGNAWLRAAWLKSGLKKVPRETQFRLAVAKVVKQLKLCILQCTKVMIDVAPLRGKGLAAGTKQEWIREQACCVLRVSSAKAFKCHGVLLKHAKSVRRGWAFNVPTGAKPLLGCYLALLSSSGASMKRRPSQCLTLEMYHRSRIRICDLLDV